MKKRFHSILFVIAIIIISVYLISSGRTGLKDMPYTDLMYSDAGKDMTSQRAVIGSEVIFMKYFSVSDSYCVTYSPLDSSLAGKEENDIEKYYAGWDMIYIDDGKIILEKKIDSCGPQTYIIGTAEMDGDEYVCVYSFDDMGEKSVYSIFDTPVMLFDEQTADTLRSGIMVKGEEALYDALEEYGE
ncbi:MAG: hypothetical protein IKM61_05855 [Eubacteriaceae bacterium]|nr:hypothetical protein [Eubacteriaceae bacterium]